MTRRFQYDDVPPVHTREGLLHGYCLDDIYIFKGVRYAQAKRFQRPQPPEPWEGVKDATSYGFVCPLLAQETPAGELMVPHRYWPMDENCQNLNIWTDTLDQEAKRPVLVWLHGGGFVAGSSIEQVAYDGFQMCRNGSVVVVSVNHRLNVLGYMDVSPYGDKYAGSANAGHADLVAALEWIRENIRAFGGNPDNVTLFGQSGGGMKITGLMQIPAADGLFHRAVVMSGVSDGTLMPEPSGDGREIVGAILRELSLGEDEIDKLETVPYPMLAQAYNKVCPAVAQRGCYVGGMPMADDFYLGEPLLHGFTEHAKTVPLMVGSVFGEFAFAPLPFDKSVMTEKEVRDVLNEKYGEHAGKVAELFQKAYPDKHLLDVLVMDMLFRVPSKALATLHARGEHAPSYLYQFNLDFPVQGGKPAWHCSDIPFFFRNTELVEVCGIPDVTEVLEEQIFRALMQFAREGDPNHGMLPHWSAVTAEEEYTMCFDRRSELKINYDDALLELLQEILPPFDFMAMMAQDVQH